MQTDGVYNLSDEYKANTAKPLNTIAHGLEEMTVLAQSTSFFWESEEGEVFRDAFLDFKDEASKLLLRLKGDQPQAKVSGRQVNDSLDSNAIF